MDKKDFVNFNDSYKISSIVFFLLIVVLSLKEFVFYPTPVPRPFIIKGEKEVDIINGINWFLENSIGSLKIKGNTCLIDKSEPVLRCGEQLEPVEPNDYDIKNLNDFKVITKNNPNTWYSIWKEKEYDKELVSQFSIFDLEVEKINKISKIPTPLGSELKVDLLVKTKGLSESAKIILKDENKFKGFEKNISVSLLKNPYGKYLPIFPLPW